MAGPSCGGRIAAHSKPFAGYGTELPGCWPTNLGARCGRLVLKDENIRIVMGVLQIDRWSERLAQGVVRRLVSTRTMFRGGYKPDGDLTLLTVAYKSRPDVERLIRSYRNHVSPFGPIVVVENSGWPRRYASSRTVGVARNLGHGIGLDFGMRFVQTEFVMTCDPDAIFTGDAWEVLRPLVQLHGAASVGIQDYLHPACMAFPVALWKRTSLSLREDWDTGHDVGGAVAEAIGGTPPSALLPATRGGGAPRVSHRGVPYHLNAVYGDVFSCTIGASRALGGAASFHETEGPFRQIVKEQSAWRAWADRFVAGTATLDEFPR